MDLFGVILGSLALYTRLLPLANLGDGVWGASKLGTKGCRLSSPLTNPTPRDDKNTKYKYNTLDANKDKGGGGTAN